jgi:hypothetical protein
VSSFSKEQINSFFPIVGLTVYPGGVVVNRICTIELWGKMHKHERGKIVKVSPKSLNRLALIVRSSKVNFTSLMTLTYGVNYPLSGRVAKKHLNAFLTDARRKFGAFDYFWVIEFQTRGAIHFHIATTLLPPDTAQRNIFADIWARISTPFSWAYCPLYVRQKRIYFETLLYTDLAVQEMHSNPRQWEAVREQDGMSRYLAKYANKLKQKEVPENFQDVGRFWGVSRGVSLPEGNRFQGSEEEVRHALWLQNRDVGHWDILPKTVLVG